MRIGIVGGGPTGLYMAILLARSGHSILLFEKRDKYTRRQIVMNAIPETIGGHALTAQERIKYFPNACAMTTAVFTDMTTAPHCYYDTDEAFLRAIPIQDLERGLARFAMDLGVVITREAARPKILSNVVDVIIGADGARSVTREALGIGMTSRKVSDAVVFNWQREANDQVGFVKGTPHLTDSSQIIDGGQNELFRMFPALGDSYQYGAIQIWDPEVAQKIKEIYGIDMTYEMVKPHIGSLVRDFSRLYAVDKKYLDRMEFNYFPISIGQANRFTGQIDNAHGFLIGDAAIGVHFFSGSGVPSGFALARLLNDALKANTLQEAATLYEEGAKQYIDAALFGMEQLHTLRNVVELGTCKKENADAFLARARGSSPTGVSAYEDKFESNVNYCMFMNGVSSEEAVKHHAFQWYRGRLRNGTIGVGDYPHDAIGKPEMVAPDAVHRPYHRRTFIQNEKKKTILEKKKTTTKKKNKKKKKKKKTTTKKKRKKKRRSSSTRRCRRGRVQGGSRRGLCRERCPNGSRFNGSTCRKRRS